MWLKTRKVGTECQELLGTIYGTEYKNLSHKHVLTDWRLRKTGTRCQGTIGVQFWKGPDRFQSRKELERVRKQHGNRAWSATLEARRWSMMGPGCHTWDGAAPGKE